MPRYESAEDRNTEQRIIEKVCARKGQIAKKLGEVKYVVDWAVFHPSKRKNHEKLSYWAEVKRRYRKYDTFPDLIISANKMVAGSRLVDIFGKPFFLIIELDDGIYHYKYNREDMKEFAVDLVGRSDRGNEFDIEPCVRIPMERFVKLKDA